MREIIAGGVAELLERAFPDALVSLHPSPYYRIENNGEVEATLVDAEYGGTDSGRWAQLLFEREGVHSVLPEGYCYYCDPQLLDWILKNVALALNLEPKHEPTGDEEV